MWAQGSPEEHSRIQSRRHAGLEPDRFGYCERARSTAGYSGDLSDEEMFDRGDQPLRFSARVEKQEAEHIEYRCVRYSVNHARWLTEPSCLPSPTPAAAAVPSD